jgi:phosphoribosylaminoimidazole-succinocarboxamide synthase
MERQKVYEGKAKILFTTEDPGQLIQYFKDEVTAFDAKKRGVIEEKGVLNNAISCLLFEHLEGKGVPTHYIKKLGPREMLVRRLEMIRLEVVVRNRVAGSLAKRLGLKEGDPLSRPITEWYYKRDDLGDPLLNEDHILALGLSDEGTLKGLRGLSASANEVLREFLEAKGLILVDLKFEFGRTMGLGPGRGALLLADEITPDTCRLWDRKTGEKLDKDRFRRDLGGVEEAYREVLRRVQG